MPTTIVYESDDKEVKAFPGLGLVLVPDTPTPVTDAQASVLLATYDNEYINATAEQAKAGTTSDGRRGKGVPNPLFGQPKWPRFKVVADEGTTTPISSAGSMPRPVLASSPPPAPAVPPDHIDSTI